MSNEDSPKYFRIKPRAYIKAVNYEIAAKTLASMLNTHPLKILEWFDLIEVQREMPQ